MKILVVVPDLSLGGVTSSVKNFCKECHKRGNDVDLIVMDGTDANLSGINQIKLEGRASLWNLNQEKLKNGKGLNKLFLLTLGAVKKTTNRYGSWLPLIFKGIKVKGNYDVAVAYRQCAPCYYFTHKCVKAQKKIAMIHGDLQFMAATDTWDIYFPCFDKIACVSYAVTDGFKQKYLKIADKFTTIYNMFDVDDILAKATAPSPFPVNPSMTNIITVSRHENGHKKVDRVVKVCSELQKHGISNFHWYIVGDGPDFDYNLKLAKDLGVTDLITFCGAMDNPFALQSKCDFTVVTSATEAYPMSVIESQILRKPVIAMRYSAVTEVIQNGINGIIVEQSVADLTLKIKELLETPFQIKKISLNLYKLIFNNDMPYQQFLNVALS